MGKKIVVIEANYKQLLKQLIAEEDFKQFLKKTIPATGLPFAYFYQDQYYFTKQKKIQLETGRDEAWHKAVLKRDSILIAGVRPKIIASDFQ